MRATRGQNLCVLSHAAGKAAVMLAPADLRRPAFDFFSRFIPDLFVVSARELAPGTTIEPAGTISLA